ncbi:tetratricopeptide repeat protein [Actinophytocola sp.]|uniref:tetratricopeptide repeat protein n=1 Tax=Actinophytocola sp. TaxID=1872138 RepID=UPI003D6C4192
MSIRSSSCTPPSSLGEDHPHAIACAINLASDLSDLGDLDAAVSTGTDAHERAEQTLGADHPITLAARLNLTTDRARAGTRVDCDLDPLPMFGCG